MNDRKDGFFYLRKTVPLKPNLPLKVYAKIHYRSPQSISSIVLRYVASSSLCWADFHKAVVAFCGRSLRFLYDYNEMTARE